MNLLDDGRPCPLAAWRNFAEHTACASSSSLPLVSTRAIFVECCVFFGDSNQLTLPSECADSGFRARVGCPVARKHTISHHTRRHDTHREYREREAHGDEEGSTSDARMPKFEAVNCNAPPGGGVESDAHCALLPRVNRSHLLVIVPRARGFSVARKCASGIKLTHSCQRVLRRDDRRGRPSIVRAGRRHARAGPGGPPQKEASVRQQRTWTRHGTVTRVRSTTQSRYAGG